MTRALYCGSLRYSQASAGPWSEASRLLELDAQSSIGRRACSFRCTVSVLGVLQEGSEERVAVKMARCRGSLSSLDEIGSQKARLGKQGLRASGISRCFQGRVREADDFQMAASTKHGGR